MVAGALGDELAMAAAVDHDAMVARDRIDTSDPRASAVIGGPAELGIAHSANAVGFAAFAPVPSAVDDRETGLIVAAQTRPPRGLRASSWAAIAAFAAFGLLLTGMWIGLRRAAG